VNISYNIGLQYAAEVLPTVVRAQGVALIHIMGYVASILAPFVVYLVSVEISDHTSVPLWKQTGCLEENLECRVRKLLDNGDNCSTTTETIVAQQRRQL